MKVSNETIQRLLQRYTEQAGQAQVRKGSDAKRSNPGNPPGAMSDDVAISGRARELYAAKLALKDQALAGVTGTREAKVQELKARIEAGTYDVRGELIAKKILDR
ncbi:MAG TPA: flagellar biosynthesis anti-sigma factor FlgM [Firmicutes bacterium]|nr:flagellar biosynthesis anti-sigma factor FlgM [Bacillota bacterium]